MMLETSTDKLHLTKVNEDSVKWSMIADLSDFQLNGFPRVVKVTSPDTGRVATFEPDLVSAERNEFWDGELMEYISKDSFAANIRLTLVND
jgi:hypothetical protein